MVVMIMKHLMYLAFEKDCQNQINVYFCTTLNSLSLTQALQAHSIIHWVSIYTCTLSQAICNVSFLSITLKQFAAVIELIESKLSQFATHEQNPLVT